MPLIGVISDTHDRVETARRGVRLLRELGAEIIIHLGDYVAPFTLKAILEEAGGASFYGVFGNNDGEKQGLLRVAGEAGATLSEPPLTVEVDGARLLLLHGFGSPQQTREITEALAASGKWSAVLYGHTHEPHRVILENGVFLLNPGDGGGVLRRPTVASVRVERGRIVEAEVHEV